jgi:MFS family permease
LQFGFLADIFGRKWMFLTTTALMIVGSIGSACTFQNDTFSIYQQMAVWRFFLGVGCGGEYPLGMRSHGHSTRTVSPAC